MDPEKLINEILNASSFNEGDRLVLQLKTETPMLTPEQVVKLIKYSYTKNPQARIDRPWFFKFYLVVFVEIVDKLDAFDTLQNGSKAMIVKFIEENGIEMLEDLQKVLIGSGIAELKVMKK